MKARAALLLVLLMSLASAQCVYFFYGMGCSHCAKAEPTIVALEAQGVEVHRFEIYGDRSNAQLLDKYFDKYGIPIGSRGVPAAFTGDRYLVGDFPIINSLEAQLQQECPALDDVNATGEVGDASSLKPEEVSIFLLTGAALVDSINPCAIAVLLILLAALMAAGGKRRALRAGLAFTVSIYISYFLFGIGIFSAIQWSGLAYWFYQFVGVLAILIGLANLKDFFCYGGGGFVMEVPRSWRPALQKILKSATSPLGAFLAGFVVCLFELPCTGGPYLFILGLLAEKTTQATAIALLLYYNLVFVLPLLVITGLFYFGHQKIGEMKEWKERNIRLLHLAAGVIMLAMGLVVVMGVV